MTARITCGDALGSAPGSQHTKKKLRGMAKNFVKKCRTPVGLLGCAIFVDTYTPTTPMRSLASSSHVASLSRVVEEDDEEEGEDEEEDEERAEEEHEE
ncbi:hypothetical protein ZWY2020_021113 [Hordeum vulgare]|nr:hypothetical protein ZWY2020_021113 [Hordeum vulgare]